MKRSLLYLSLLLITILPISARGSQPIPSEFQRLAELALASDKSPHNYTAIYNVGEYALALCVHLIRSASESIDIQTFIWKDDPTTRFIFSELVAAADRGVKVRVLIDHLTKSADNVDPIAAMAVAHPNIELRFFNPISDKAINHIGNIAFTAVTRFSKLNRRMHNKLLVVDSKIGVTGGRNYQTVYFDWDEKFNFKDRDILVCGPVSQQMQSSFDEYWNHKRAIPFQEFRDVRTKLRSWNKHPIDTSSILEFDTGKFSEVSNLASKYSLASHISDGTISRTEKMQYIWDPPVMRSKTRIEKDPEHWTPLAESILNAEDYLIVQTPYLVASKRMKRLVSWIHSENPDFSIHCSTNSIAASDHFSVGAVALKQQKQQIRELNFQIHQFKPHPADINKLSPRYDELTTGPRYSIHAKSIVIDGEVAVVSTSNFDPRSAYLNTECAIIIHDAEIALRLEQDIRRDMSPRNSWTIAPRKQTPILGHANDLIASISDLLPVLDAWPIPHTSCFQLEENKVPLSPDHPSFYDHYRDVGNFAGCKDTTLIINTHIAKAAIGWATPMM